MKKADRYGKGKVPIATTIPADAHDLLRKQAAQNNETVGAYARRLLVRGLRRPILVIETEDDSEATLGKPAIPPQPAPIASGRVGSSMPAPMLNEDPGTRYTAPRRGSRPAPSAP
jgi:hypothetical protein